MPSVTIRADHIQDLKIVEDAKSQASKSASGGSGAGGTSTVEVKKKVRTQVADNLARANLAQQRSSGGATGGGKSTKVNNQLQDSQQQQHYHSRGGGSPKKAVQQSASSSLAAAHSGESSGGFRTPNKRLQQMMRRDNACFGDDMDYSTSEEFDFEKNLALFDKRLVFQEIEMENSNQPDVVRLVDCNLRQNNKSATPTVQQQQQAQPPPTRSEMEPKYRNDQNVLATIPAQYRQISLDKTLAPSLRGEYSTDNGLVVPSIALGLRERLMLAAEARGISRERMAELMARSVADMTIQMLGGARRLNPDNAHQVPRVVALCGPGRSGSYGLASLRHLASQGVHTTAYLPSFPMYPPHVDAELLLYKLCLKKRDNVLIYEANDLPAAAAGCDVLLLALDDHEMLEQERSQPWHRAAIAWARANGGPLVLALDPLTPDKAKAELNIKASILPGLPLWYPDDSCGKLYMANLGLPVKVYKDVGISFTSPFGAKTCTTLNVLKQ